MLQTLTAVPEKEEADFLSFSRAQTGFPEPGERAGPVLIGFNARIILERMLGVNR
jgi:hypothetical protein